MSELKEQADMESGVFFPVTEGQTDIAIQTLYFIMRH